MALETTLQSILRTMRQRAQAKSVWEYGHFNDDAVGRMRYVVIGKVDGGTLAFSATSLHDISVGYFFETVSETYATFVTKLDSDFVCVIDGEHGDRFPTQISYSGSGPYTIRVRVSGAKMELLANAIACAQRGTTVGLYGGEEIACAIELTAEGAPLAFASFFAGLQTGP